MNIHLLTAGIGHTALTETLPDAPNKIAGVATQFEALMIGQMLKTAREATGGGWLGNENDHDDQTGSMVMEMAEQGFSQAMAARGGLGIAKMIAANLERGQAKSASSDSAVPPPPGPADMNLERQLSPAPAPARRFPL